MSEHVEMPSIVTLLAERVPSEPLAHFLRNHESLVFSWLIMGLLIACGFLAGRRPRLVPSAGQNALEAFVSFADDFIVSILGPRGRIHVPFLGTLFVYILVMNLMGLIPFLRSPSANFSTTAALAVCVFVYVQFFAFKELGFLGYADHMAGNPRGLLAVSVVIPIFMFFIHLITEIVRPLTLALRLRSNIWGDDFLLSMLAGMGFNASPLLLFSSLLTVIAAVVQAAVFCLLATVYLALVMKHEPDNHIKEAKHGL